MLDICEQKHDPVCDIEEMSMISIIIPTYNEEQSIETTLQNILRLKKEAKIEIIVSDGGSIDKTIAIAQRYAIIVKSKKGKSHQLNTAASKAKGDILFFVQADMFLPKGTLKIIVEKIEQQNYDGGGFSNVFSSYNKKIKYLGRLLNFRLWDNDHAKNIVFFGDNGIFVKKTVFHALNGFKPIPIMEDYDFSIRMRDNFKVVRILNPKLVISPRRHIKTGFVKTRLLWIIIKRLYQLGVSPNTLAKLYLDVR